MVTINCVLRRGKSRIVEAGYHRRRSAYDYSDMAPRDTIIEFAPETRFRGNRSGESSNLATSAANWRCLCMDVIAAHTLQPCFMIGNAS